MAFTDADFDRIEDNYAIDLPDNIRLVPQPVGRVLGIDLHTLSRSPRQVAGRMVWSEVVDAAGRPSIQYHSATIWVACTVR